MEEQEIIFNSDLVQEALAFTKEVTEAFPGRITGSDSCFKTAKKIKGELEKYCDPGTVKMEEFPCHPQAFLKYIPFLVLLYLACSLLLFFGQPLWAFVGFALGNFVFYGQFVRYYEILDPLFPKRKGFNVWGAIEPAQKAREQIIVSAHHDAAYVFQLLARFPRLYAYMILTGIGFLFLGLVISLLALILSLLGIAFPQWPSIVLLVGLLPVLPFLFFTTNQVSPGAGDNMIAVAIMLQVAKVFSEAKKNGNPLNSTRLLFVSFDAEEAGLRGARAFIKAHREELQAIPTRVLNIDTVYKLQHLNFFERDLNSFVPLSKELASECATVARSLGYPDKVSGMSFGGGSTDAAAFGEEGIEATNICAMSFNINDYKEGFVYHTSRDTVEHIEPQAVEAIIKVIGNYILKRDRGN
ncbi:MAG: M28 family metallopeptidase [Caldiserica bacterium]|nr:M28 family metallopeptidase [Caldisericota bacterium]MDH7562841.1 M28 family peptidase [Caldisericota bacterium]